MWRRAHWQEATLAWVISKRRLSHKLSKSPEPRHDANDVTKSWINFRVNVKSMLPIEGARNSEENFVKRTDKNHKENPHLFTYFLKIASASV